MKLFMDESGNGNASQPLIVGAVELGDDAEAIEDRILDLYQKLSAKKQFISFGGFDKFRKDGFHGANDPREVSSAFLNLLQSIFFRAYMVVTNRGQVPGKTELERIEFMYVKLLSDLSIRHRNKPEMLCYIEENSGLESIIRRLPESVARRTYEVTRRSTPLPQLNIEMVAKGQYMSTAIIDYVMTAVSRWLRAERTTDAGCYEYRGFREIEPYISVLYSFEHGRLSSRKKPLH